VKFCGPAGRGFCVNWFVVHPIIAPATLKTKITIPTYAAIPVLLGTLSESQSLCRRRLRVFLRSFVDLVVVFAHESEIVVVELRG